MVVGCQTSPPKPTFLGQAQALTTLDGPDIDVLATGFGVDSRLAGGRIGQVGSHTLERAHGVYLLDLMPLPSDCVTLDDVTTAYPRALCTVPPHGVGETVQCVSDRHASSGGPSWVLEFVEPSPSELCVGSMKLFWLSGQSVQKTSLMERVQCGLGLGCP